MSDAGGATAADRHRWWSFGLTQSPGTRCPRPQAVPVMRKRPGYPGGLRLARAWARRFSRRTRFAAARSRARVDGSSGSPRVRASAQTSGSSGVSSSGGRGEPSSAVGTTLYRQPLKHITEIGPHVQVVPRRSAGHERVQHGRPWSGLGTADEQPVVPSYRQCPQVTLDRRVVDWHATVIEIVDQRLPLVA